MNGSQSSVCAQAPPDKAPRRRCVLIGIDQYPKCASRLRGCENDVRLMQHVLMNRFCFEAADIHVLINKQATRTAILDELEWLVEQSRPEDTAVLFFAGHGSRRLAASKLSGWDQTLVPADSGRGIYPNLDISDDEIKAWLLRLAENTALITLLFDCCHAATQHRDVFAGLTRSLPPDAPDLAAQDSAHPSPAGRPGIRTRPWLPEPSRYVVLAACRDAEVARELTVEDAGSQRHYGTFTYHLAQQLAGAGPNTTYRDVIERTAQAVRNVVGSQNPYAEGDLNRILFGAQVLSPPSEVLIVEVTGDRARLDVGHLHGVRVGALWEVVPSGPEAQAQAEGRDAKACAPRARIAIDQASVLTASGQFLGSPAVVAHQRAVLISQPLLDKLPVDLIDGNGHQILPGTGDLEPGVAAMYDALNAAAWVRLTRAGESARARLYPVPARTHAGPMDPVQQLGARTRPCWAVIGPDGDLLMPLQPLEAVAAVRNNLEKHARSTALRELQNPCSALAGEVEFKLLHKTEYGPWLPVPQEPAQVPWVRAGTRIAFELRSRHTSPLFIAILLLDANGAIELLYPPPYGHQELAPGPARQIGIDEGPQMEAVLPDGRLSLDPAQLQISQDVVDYYKLLVSTEPIQTAPLLQAEYRHASAPSVSGGPLNQILAQLGENSTHTRSVHVTPRAPTDFTTGLLALKIVR